MERISSGASTSREISTSPENEINFTIRKCRVEDLDQILEIEKTSFPNPYDRSLFTHFLTEGASGFLVAEKEGRIIGYLIFTNQRKLGTIVSIAVSPEYRRRGVGRRLLGAALNQLSSKANIVELQVSAKNEDAIEFYRKFSFRQTAILRMYYPNGEDAILMSRKF